jgi:hypothetical protein
MAVELFLEFAEDKLRGRVLIDVSPFFIGRAPDNNLQIANTALSRRHCKIERFGDVFVLSDANSSNGTQLNGAELAQPAALKNGDEIRLGNAIVLRAVIEGESEYKSVSQTLKTVRAATDAGEIPFWQTTGFITLLFGLTFILLVGVTIFVFIGGGSSKSINRQTAAQNEDSEDLPLGNLRKSPRENRRSERAGDNQTNASNNAEVVAPPQNANIKSTSGEDDEAAEKFALQFLRSVSENPNPVLNSKQVALIAGKIKALKNAAAFRENLRAARSANFDSTAKAHNLKPALLRAASLAKLNDSRGNPTAVAEQIAPGIKNFADVLGTELANDTLLTVAAFAEGGSPNVVRDRVANLAKTSPGVSVAEVRTIWFLKQNGKLSDAAFDFALRFLAAGTVMQNPQAFGF